MNKAYQKRPVNKNKERYVQIKDGMEQYKKAINDGYYIEAIALMESAISDRMESALNYLYPLKDYSYGTVGRLAEALMNSNCYSKKLLSDIKIWSKKRNDTIHQMMKLLPDQNESFQQRYDDLKQCAEEGLKLFRRFDSEHKKLKQFQDSHPLIFKLKDQDKKCSSYPEVLKIKCKVSNIQMMQDNKLYEQTTVFEDENGTLWRKQLLDLYYDRVESKE